MSEMQRREVFSSFATRFKKSKEVVIRPPYFNDVSLFDKECPTCSDKTCATLCEEEIIFIDEKGLPYISFQDSGCTYCDKCAVSCLQEVLKVENKADVKAKVSILVKECLAWNETICSSCLDACDKRAIKFFGMFRPIVETSLCNNCGFCYSVCPSSAILIKGV